MRIKGVYLKKSIDTIIGLIFVFIGFYFIKSDWGFLLLTVGGYLFFSSLKV